MQKIRYQAELGRTVRIEPSFLYIVCKKHFYKPAENQTVSRKFPEIMVKNAH